MTGAEIAEARLEADDEIHVPLDMESIFGWGTWLFIGIVTIFLALLFALIALIEGELALGILAGAGILFGLYALRKVLKLLIKSLTISSDGISLRRGLHCSHLKWKDVRFYRYGLMVQNLPHHATFAIICHTDKACFEVRNQWYEEILTRLEKSCPHAFSLDSATGCIRRPTENEIGDFAHSEFKRIAHSECRRFRLLAILQIIALPIFLILAVAALWGPVLGSRWKHFPYGFSHIQANFSRARYAWQSYLCDSGTVDEGIT